VSDRNIKELVLEEFQHGGLKNRVYAAIGRPAPPSAINADVVNFRTTFAILIVALVAQIEQLQNVVEDLEQTQFRWRIAAAETSAPRRVSAKLDGPEKPATS
jgi:hypothetical protein